MSEGLWNRRGSRPAHITKVSRIMDDRELTDLLYAHAEEAVERIREKYGAYCRYIAGQILAAAVAIRCGVVFQVISNPPIP